MSEKAAWFIETPLLDFNHPSIQQLVQERGWLEKSEYDKIGAAYDYVRNEIRFGYNRSDDIPASEILKDGYGQCNTKGTLLMALLRALGIPCRIHGFTIHKSLQRGVVPELVYPIAPENILHSWIEVFHEQNWVKLEGFILDDQYLKELQKGLGNTRRNFCAYGAGTEDISDPQVNWCGRDTYIQRTGINNDLGVFSTPDEFYALHNQQFSVWKRWIYENFIRHWMNTRTVKMRKGELKPENFKTPLKKNDWKQVLKIGQVTET